jgi:hypothetical protein
MASPWFILRAHPRIFRRTPEDDDMTDELQEIRENLTKLSDEELEQMVTVDADDYVPAAIDLARRELDARGITLEEKPPVVAAAAGEDFDADEATGQAGGNTPLFPCPVCNGPVRQAALMAKDEIIAVFRDNDERRFVDLFVCSKCGEARLVVDLETIVAEQ